MFPKIVKQNFHLFIFLALLFCVLIETDASKEDESDLSGKALTQAQIDVQEVGRIASTANSDIKLIDDAKVKAEENAKLAETELTRVNNLLPKPVSLAKEADDAKKAADGAVKDLLIAQLSAKAAKTEIDTVKTNVDTVVAQVKIKDDAVKQAIEDKETETQVMTKRFETEKEATNIAQDRRKAEIAMETLKKHLETVRKKANIARLSTPDGRVLVKNYANQYVQREIARMQQEADAQSLAQANIWG